jgi:hypothetical protein
MAFLLGDPGLALPPETDNHHEHRTFWSELVVWATDRRVRFGPLSYSVVVDYFTSNGWPDYKPPSCPVELGTAARSALASMLAALIDCEADCTELPVMTPRYTRFEDGALAIGGDLAAQWSETLLGLASNPTHWDAPATEVRLAPPPPERVKLVFTPHQPVAEETDLRVARFMRGKRVHIVGGLPSADTITTLAARFEIEPRNVTWLESEPSKPPNLRGWRSLAGHRDVAICVIGTQGVLGCGHSTSETAERYAVNRGVLFLKVQRPSEIPGRLCDRLGRP